MTAEAVVYAVLSAAAGVSALVGARIYPGQVPEARGLPAIGVEHISGVRVGRIDAQAPTHPTQSRIQVNLLATSYPQLKSLRAAVIAALQYQRGPLAGVQVISVLPDTQGPDTVDPDAGVYHQPLDFLVYHMA